MVITVIMKDGCIFVKGVERRGRDPALSSLESKETRVLDYDEEVEEEGEVNVRGNLEGQEITSRRRSEEGTPVEVEGDGVAVEGL